MNSEWLWDFLKDLSAGKASGATVKFFWAGNKFALRFFEKTTKKVGNMLEADGKERRLRQ